MAKGIYVGVKSTLDPTQDSFKIVDSSKQDFVDRKIIVPGGVGGSKYWDTTNMTSSTFYPNEAVDFASSTIWPSSFNFSNKFFLFSNDLTHLYQITSVSNKTEIKTEISTRALDPGSSVEITASGSVYDIAEISSVARKVKKMYVGVDTQVPIMSETTQQLTLNDTNLKEFFDVSAETGTNKWTPLNITGGGVSFSPGNYGVNSTTATCTLTAKENLTNIVIGYSYVTEKSCDKVTIVRNGSTLLNAASGSNTGTFDATTLAKGQTIKLTYTKDSSQSASGEKVSIDITCDPIEKTVQTITGYEMQEIARKIKKGYVGVGGVARPFFSESTIEFYSMMKWHSANSSSAFTLISSFYAGNCAVFLTNVTDSGPMSPHFLDNTLTMTVGSSYYSKYMDMPSNGATTNKYVIFIGGTYYPGNGILSTGVAYDTSKTKNTNISYPTSAMSITGATLSDNDAIFVGGWKVLSNGNTQQYKYAVSYNDSLTRTTLNSLTTAGYDYCFGNVKDYVIFIGGRAGGGIVPTGDVYSSSGTKVSVLNETLNVNQQGMSIGNYVLFIGPSGNSKEFVQGYDSSFTKISDIAYPYYNFGANIGVKEFGVTIGGLPDQTNKKAIPIIIEKSLTITPIEKIELDTANSGNYINAGRVGDFLVFQTGSASTTKDNTAVFRIMN